MGFFLLTFGLKHRTKGINSCKVWIGQYLYRKTLLQYLKPIIWYLIMNVRMPWCDTSKSCKLKNNKLSKGFIFMCQLLTKYTCICNLNSLWHHAYIKYCFIITQPTFNLMFSNPQPTQKKNLKKKKIVDFVYFLTKIFFFVDL